MTGRHPLYTAAGSGCSTVNPATTAVIAVAATSGIHMFTSPTMCSDCDPSTVVCRMPTTPTSTNRHRYACSSRKRSPRAGSSAACAGNVVARLRRASVSAETATATKENTLAANDPKSGTADTSAHWTPKPPSTWATPVAASGSAANTSSHAPLSTICANPHSNP